MPVNSLAFGKNLRVRKGGEYQQIYRKGRRFHHAVMTLVVFNRPVQAGKGRNVPDNEITRLGLSVSRKVGNAVHRNRVKRRLREIFRLNRTQLKSGTDLVVVPKPSAAGLAYADLKKIFLDLCGKAQIL